MTFSWEYRSGHFFPVNAIPLSDRGFRYGMTLFESLRLSNGYLHFAEAHLELLRNSASTASFPIPTLTAKELISPLSSLPPNETDWFVRIYLTAGDGSPSAPITEPRLFIFAEPRPRPLPLHTHLLSHTKPYLTPFKGLKTTHYWPNITAIQSAIQQNHTDSLLFNPDGNIVSAATSNVFFKIQNNWVTPDLSSGSRPGTIRAWVLSNLSVSQKPLTANDLQFVQSAFLTNSWLGIQPVSFLNGNQLVPCPDLPPLQTVLDAAITPHLHISSQ